MVAAHKALSVEDEKASENREVSDVQIKPSLGWSVQTDDVYLLGLSIGGFHRNTQVFLFAAAVFFVYQLWAFAEEFLIRQRGFKYAFFVAGVKFSSGSFFALCHAFWKDGGFTKRAPWYWYLVIGFFSAATSGLTITSLNHVNYPTMVVFKSAKIIPVMLAGVVVLRKRYRLNQILAALSFVLGMILFAWGDHRVLTGNSDTLGLVCLLVSLVFDALLGVYQEKVMREYQVDENELMVLAHSAAGALCLAMSAAQQQASPALHVLSISSSLAASIMILCLTAYFGQLLILGLVRHYGALTCAVVTSLRKLVTVLCSFLVFPKPFSVLYLIGALVVTLASALHSCSDRIPLLSLITNPPTSATCASPSHQHAIHTTCPCAPSLDSACAACRNAHGTSVPRAGFQSCVAGSKPSTTTLHSPLLRHTPPFHPQPS